MQKKCTFVHFYDASLLFTRKWKSMCLSMKPKTVSSKVATRSRITLQQCTFSNCCGEKNSNQKQKNKTLKMSKPFQQKSLSLKVENVGFKNMRTWWSEWKSALWLFLLMSISCKFTTMKSADRSTASRSQKFGNPVASLDATLVDIPKHTIACGK